MQVMNQVEVLNLRDLEDQTDTSLFVLNNTEPRGEIVFNVTVGRGRDYIVVVPDTWVPFDLTTQAKKSEILDSPDFRRAVTQKYLTVVSTKSADEFLRDNEYATAELHRVYNKAGGQNNIAANSDRPNSDRTNIGKNESKLDQIRQSTAGIPAEQAVEESISGAVMQIVARSNSESEDRMDVKEAISLLMGRKLNSKELEYIMKASNQEALKAFASKQV